MKNQIPNDILHVLLMRHAEPVTYGFKNSRLSRTGIEQVTKIANQIVESYLDGTKHKLRIFYSSRKRAKESGIRLDGELRRIIIDKKIKNIQIFEPGVKKIFQTADSINHIIGLGYPLQNALDAWSKLSPEELKKSGIQSPEEIVKKILKFFRQIEISDLTDIIVVTHETTLIAFQKKYFPKIKSRPKYTEIIELIFYNNSDLFTLRFREKEIKVNAFS